MKKFLTATVLVSVCAFAFTQEAFAKNIDFYTGGGIILSNTPFSPSGYPVGNNLLPGNTLTPGEELGQSFKANTQEATIGLFLERTVDCNFATTVKLNLYQGEGTDPQNLIDSQDVSIPACFRGFVEQDYRNKEIFFNIGDMYTISVTTPEDAGGNFVVPTTGTNGYVIGYRMTSTGSYGTCCGYSPIYGGAYIYGNSVINGVVNFESVLNDMTGVAMYANEVPGSAHGDHYFRVIDWNPETFTFVSAIPNAEVGTTYAPINLVNPSSLILAQVQAYNIPAGMSVDPATGVLSGTPTAAGTYTINLGAIVGNLDFVGQSAYTTMTITINPAPVVTSSVSFVTALADGKVGKKYSSRNLIASGVATVSATGIPKGMKVSSSGKLSGTPTEAGVFQINVTATEENGIVTTATIEIDINPATTTTTTVTTISEEGGKITAIGNEYIMLEKIKVNYTSATEIIGTLTVDKEVLYWGTKASDGTITATKISVK